MSRLSAFYIPGQTWQSYAGLPSLRGCMGTEYLTMDIAPSIEVIRKMRAPLEKGAAQRAGDGSASKRQNLRSRQKDSGGPCGPDPLSSLTPVGSSLQRREPAAEAIARYLGRAIRIPTAAEPR